MNGEPTQRPLLILDLDETLVKAFEQPRADRAPDFLTSEYFVYKRPHLDEFLLRMWKLYDIAVWSAAGTLYVNRVVEETMKGHPAPVFVFSGTRCTRRFDHEIHQAYYIKDLKKVRKKGFDPRRMLIVDDLQLNAQRNFGNAVYIDEYDGGTQDEELLHLAAYLESLASQPNFRTIEKRFWRKRNPAA
jgi:RNA polymerase II subunit A small phosphatase-like protein